MLPGNAKDMLKQTVSWKNGSIVSLRPYRHCINATQNNNDNNDNDDHDDDDNDDDDNDVTDTIMIINETQRRHAATYTHACCASEKFQK